MNDLQEGRGIGENAGAKKAVRAAAILQRHHSRISEINIKGQVKGVIRERFLKGRTDVFKDRPAVFQVEIKNDIQSNGTFFRVCTETMGLENAVKTHDNLIDFVADGFRLRG